MVIIPAGFVGLVAFKIQQNGLFQLDSAWTDFAYIGLFAHIGFYVLRMLYHFPYTFPLDRNSAMKADLEILINFILILLLTRSQSLIDSLSIFGLLVVQANALFTIYLIVVLGLGAFFRHVFLRSKDRHLISFVASYTLYALICLPVFILGLGITLLLSIAAVISLLYSIPLYIGDASGVFAALLFLQYFIAIITVYRQTGRVNATFVSDQQNNATPAAE